MSIAKIQDVWKDCRNKDGRIWFASEKCADNIRGKVFIWQPEKQESEGERGMR